MSLCRSASPAGKRGACRRHAPLSGVFERHPTVRDLAVLLYLAVWLHACCCRQMLEQLPARPCAHWQQAADAHIAQQQAGQCRHAIGSVFVEQTACSLHTGRSVSTRRRWRAVQANAARTNARGRARILSRHTLGRTKPWRWQTREGRWGARSSLFSVMDRRSKEGRGLG